MQPFIGLDDLSDSLGEDVSTSDLAVIAIDSACQVVRDYLGNDVNLAEDDAITIDGNGRNRLILPEGPVREVSEVIENGVTLDPTDYALEDGRTVKGMFLRRVGYTAVPSLINNYYGSWYPCWLIGVANIAITYTHGWDVEEPSSEPPADFERVPSSIRKVALSLAKRIYTSSGSSSGVSGAVTGEKIGGYSYTVDTASAVATSSIDLLETEIGSLRPYQEYGFG